MKKLRPKLSLKRTSITELSAKELRVTGGLVAYVTPKDLSIGCPCSRGGYCENDL